MILALDLATQCGCCHGGAAGKPRLWTWDLRDGGPVWTDKLGMLARFMAEYLDEYRPNMAVYELPMPLAPMMERGAREETVALLRGAIGVAVALCSTRGMLVRGVRPGAARKAVLGWSRNTQGNTKARVFEEVKALYRVAPQNHNEADAFVLWRWACNEADPALAAASAPLFLSAEPGK